MWMNQKINHIYFAIKLIKKFNYNDRQGTIIAVMNYND